MKPVDFFVIIGDFSILLQSGMTKCKAILFNLLSASMCMIGLFVGIALGANQEIRTWLIALTAGMFIYVALVDMVSIMYLLPLYTLLRCQCDICHIFSNGHLILFTLPSI